MNVVEVLQVARKVLVVSGWTRHRMRAVNGKVCATGAVGVAVDPAAMADSRTQNHLSENLDFAAATTALQEHLPEKYKGFTKSPAWDVAYYNDHIATNQDDILDLYDKTIADLGGNA